MLVRQDMVDTALDGFAVLPDPGRAGTLDELTEQLRLLKAWAGDPSYDAIKRRVNAAWAAAGRAAGELVGRTTVVDCFRPGRRRLNTDLVVGVVEALHPEVGYVNQWRQALRVIGGESPAASQVRVQNVLPPALGYFTGRAAELDRLGVSLREHQRSAAGAAVAIVGMPGVGKTQLAIHAAHQLCQQGVIDRVLFVNLRGFHPDPAQPSADPAAVLDSFLRVLGVPGQRIPHDLRGRVLAYRDRLAGTRTLVLLDNAADEEQVRHILPETPGCIALITSRTSLGGLPQVTEYGVDVLDPEQAARFVTRTAPTVPVGGDADAAARIARRCGYLPLALGVVAAYIQSTTGWTLTDHADRLDERMHERRLDGDVELALDLSYQHLPADARRLLRLAALAPGQDFGTAAAAALIDTDLPYARTGLDHLCRAHLLQRTGPDRYTYHDLVRAFATSRATDEDAPPVRRTALTRLFDHYLGMAAEAMDVLHPAEHARRPAVKRPASITPPPDPDAARTWLDLEMPTLVAVAERTASHGWPVYTTQLSTILFRYLVDRIHAGALAIHEHARHAAQDLGDVAAEAHASLGLGVTYMRLSRYDRAGEHLRQALALFGQHGDRAGQARALSSLGIVEGRCGRYREAVDRHQQSLDLFQHTDDQVGEARQLGNLGYAQARLGRWEPAAEHYRRAMALFERADDRTGYAVVLSNLGEVEMRLGRYPTASRYLEQALALCRELGQRACEGWTLDSLGTLHVRTGRVAEGIDLYRQALAAYEKVGDRDGEAWAHNGLGEAACAEGRYADALTYHAAAHKIAVGIGARDQQARAYAGLARANDGLGDPDAGRCNRERAEALYAEIGIA
jgi:tetratricopeptide (TPR) repeat protein